MVEDRFGYGVADQMIEDGDLPSGGAHTAVGAYSAFTAHALTGDEQYYPSCGMDDDVSEATAMDELTSVAPSDGSEFIDLTSLQRRWGELAMQLIVNLIPIFLQTAEDNIAEFEAAVAAEDAGQLYAIAHKIKSAGANVGAVRLAALCEDLEQMGRLGQLDGLQEKTALVLEEFQGVRRALAVIYEDIMAV